MTLDEFRKAVNAYLDENPAYQGFRFFLDEKAVIEPEWLATLKLEEERLFEEVSLAPETMMKMGPKELLESLAGPLMASRTT